MMDLSWKNKEFFLHPLGARKSKYRAPMPLPQLPSVQPLLTILCAGPQEVDDVFVLPNHLHHLHLRHQVRKVLLSGIIWEHGEITDQLQPQDQWTKVTLSEMALSETSKKFKRFSQVKSSSPYIRDGDKGEDSPTSPQLQILRANLGSVGVKGQN